MIDHAQLGIHCGVAKPTLVRWRRLQFLTQAFALPHDINLCSQVLSSSHPAVEATQKVSRNVETFSLSPDASSIANATNPLTVPLTPNPNHTPAERAIDRFAIQGNAIVTGGAGGLGLEATRALLEHGAKGVCIFDLAVALENGRTSLQALYDEFPDCKIIEEAIDVTDEACVQAAVERAAEALGSVDILLCFAGIVVIGIPALDMDLESWKKVLDINLTGSLLCSKYAAKEMVKQGSGGSIVLVSSIAGHKALIPLYISAYSSSKAAVLGLTNNLAGEWAQYGIRVNCLCPGYMKTNMTEPPEIQPGSKAYIERTPMGRLGHPREITGPVIMFCSAAGRYITGVNIFTDGGHHVF